MLNLVRKQSQSVGLSFPLLTKLTKLVSAYQSLINIASSNDPTLGTAIGVEGMLEPLRGLTEQFGTKSLLAKLEESSVELHDWIKAGTDHEPADETEIPF